MIVRERPDLTYRATREAFLEHAVRASCVIVARTARAVRPALEAPALSLHAAWGATEEHTICDRRVLVDDDNFLLVSPHSLHASSLRARRPALTLAIYFRPGLAESVLGRPEYLPDRSLQREQSFTLHDVAFMDQLVPHERSITPVLRYIAETAQSGFEDEAWYDEQLVFLLQRLGEALQRAHDSRKGLAIIRPAKREQLLRRIGRARDFILSNYDRPLTLPEMAEAAHLSRFHFARLFRQFAGVSPYTFLQRKRAAVALRLLRTTDLSLDEISQRCGLGHRSTVYRLCRQFRGENPRQLRAGADAGVESAEYQQRLDGVTEFALRAPRMADSGHSEASNGADRASEISTPRTHATAVPA